VSISIKHCVDRDFLDLFRADLAAGEESVELLSPFVSLNRSSNYYAAFASLYTRSVPVHAYVRPHQEQPESLRPGFIEAIRNLELRGIQVSYRSGMHEKVAAIDRRILWHGSLNILSHNDSRESMLRFESRELVAEVLRDLGLASVCQQQSDEAEQPADPQDELPSTGPKCAICGGPMRLFESAGIWVCEDSPRCSGIRSVGAAEVEAEAAIAEMQGDLELGCPLCGQQMIVKGILRRTISCPSPTCGFSLEPRLSAGILRIIGRRQSV